MTAETWRLIAGGLPRREGHRERRDMRKAIVFIGTLGAFLAGCQTPPPRTATAVQKKADEYVWYTPTGSHLPIYIKKSELTERENTRSDQEAMRDATRRGLHMDRTGD